MTIVTKSYSGTARSIGKNSFSSRSSKNNDAGYSTGTNKKKTNAKRKSASLPSETVEYLKAWMMSPEHIAHPYPTEQEKVEIMKDTGIEMKQLTNWFVNNRKRYWKPRVEARLQQQAQAAQAVVQAHAAAVVAVSIACGGRQQQPQQQAAKPSDIATVTTTTVKVAAVSASVANLVSPNVNGFKSVKAPLNIRRNDDDIADTSIITSTAALSSLRKKPFASPLTYAAQMIEQIQDESVVVPTTSIMSATTASFTTEEVNSRIPISVSVSEGEMSDSGTDDSSSLSSDSTTSVSGSKKSIKNNPITSHISYPEPEDEETSKTMNTRSVSFSSLELFSHNSLSPEEIKTNSESMNCTSYPFLFIDNNSKKRTLIVNNNEDVFPVGIESTTSSCTNPSPPPRKRFRSVSIDVWIDACRNASHINDECLPSMEEASRLFGYTN